MITPPVIIVADPDPIFRSVLRVAFSHSTCTVILADTCREAEVIAAQALATLVVLDVIRSGLAAFEACARIRRSSGYAERPIVLTTNQMNERVRAAAQTAGATAVLAKPYSMQDLAQSVRSHLGSEDPLMAGRPTWPGAADVEPKVWAARETHVPVAAGGDSALAQNGRLLPIVRGSGVKMPVLRSIGRAPGFGSTPGGYGGP